MVLDCHRWWVQVTRDECEAWEWWYAHRMENLYLLAPISLSSSHPLLQLPPAHANLNHPPPATAVHWFLLLSLPSLNSEPEAHIYANKHDHTTARSCLSHTPPLAIFRTHSSPPTLSLFLCYLTIHLVCFTSVCCAPHLLGFHLHLSFPLLGSWSGQRCLFTSGGWPPHCRVVSNTLSLELSF